MSPSAAAFDPLRPRLVRAASRRQGWLADVFGQSFAEIAAVIAAGGGSRIMRFGFINGLPGLVTLEPDGQARTTALAVEDGRIVGIYVVRNPEKLERVGRGAPCAAKLPLAKLESDATFQIGK